MKYGRHAFFAAGAILALAALAAVRLRTPAPEVSTGQAPLPAPPHPALIHGKTPPEHLRRLREQAEEDRREFGPASPEERLRRIDAGGFSPQQRDALRRIVQEDPKSKAAYEGAVAGFERELERLQTTPPEAEPKKSEPAEAPAIEFVVDLASSSVLPFQPLVVQLHAVNRSGRDLEFRSGLDPSAGFLTLSAAAPGSGDFEPLSLSGLSPPLLTAPRNPPRLPSGGRISYQTELPFHLPLRGKPPAVALGAWRLRFELEVPGSRTPKSFEAEIRVTSPGAGDGAMFAAIAEDLSGLLGTRGDLNGLEQPETALKRAAALCQAHPGSAYAPFLRTGVLRLLLGQGGALAEAPAAETQARLKAALQASTSLDAPSGWARAELLLLHAEAAAALKEPEREKAALERFVHLCPGDSRAAGIRDRLAR